MSAPLRFDFVAADGAHLGQFLSLDDQIAAIPSPIGIWDRPTPANTTLDGGRVSTWTAGNGRQWLQANAARRPSLATGVAAMDMVIGNAPGASMELQDGGLGVLSEFSFAILADLTVAGAETTDLHYLAGQDLGSVCRVSYRYTSNNNYIRFETPGRVLGADVPASPGLMPIIITITGGVTARLQVGTISATGAMTAAPVLTGFEIGNRRSSGGSPPDWPGQVHKSAMWTHALDDAERALVLEWLTA